MQKITHRRPTSYKNYEIALERLEQRKKISIIFREDSPDAKNVRRNPLKKSQESQIKQIMGICLVFLN